MSSENECNTPAQEHMKQICGDLCKLEGKMQTSDFLDFVVSEVSKYLVDYCKSKILVVKTKWKYIRCQKRILWENDHKKL